MTSRIFGITLFWLNVICAFFNLVVCESPLNFVIGLANVACFFYVAKSL